MCEKSRVASFNGAIEDGDAAGTVPVTAGQIMTRYFRFKALLVGTTDAEVKHRFLTSVLLPLKRLLHKHLSRDFVPHS